MTRNRVVLSSQLAHLRCWLQILVLHQGLSVHPAALKAAPVCVPSALQNSIDPCTFSKTK